MVLADRLRVAQSAITQEGLHLAEWISALAFLLPARTRDDDGTSWRRRGNNTMRHRLDKVAPPARSPHLVKDLHLLWRHRRWRLALLSCAVVAAIVAVSGGFRPVGSTGSALPVSGAGAPVESDAFVVTPLCAWIADVRPGQLSPPDGEQRHLILRARVVSKARDWVAMRAYLDKDVIWLPEGEGDPVVAERSQRADDATLGQDLGPGLPVVLDFIWDLPVGMAPPATSTWGMFKRRFVERSHASGESMWVQDGPGWKFALPVSQTCPGDIA